MRNFKLTVSYIMHVYSYHDTDTIMNIFSTDISSRRTVNYSQIMENSLLSSKNNTCI